MTMNIVHVVKSTILRKEAAWVVLSRSYAAGGKAKKGGKGGGSSHTLPSQHSRKKSKPAQLWGPISSRTELTPKVLGDSEYPDWLWHLVDKRLPLSELQRKEAESLSIDDLKRYIKLDNRARIKENNSVRAKN